MHGFNERTNKDHQNNRPGKGERDITVDTYNKEEQSLKPESKARDDVIGKGIDESAIKKEEKPAKPESKGREEGVRKESPSQKPFSYPGK